MASGSGAATPRVARYRNEPAALVRSPSRKAVQAPSAAAAESFAELKTRYDQHLADWHNEPEARIRLETLESIARLDDPRVIPFLLYTVQKEPHFDICEEAAKSLGRPQSATAVCQEVLKRLLTADER